MSPTLAPAAKPHPDQGPLLPRPARRRWSKFLRRIAVWMVVLMVIATGAWYAVRSYRKIETSGHAPIPTARVTRGDLSLSVTSRAELYGGHPEVLTAPQAGGGEMHIINLRTPGDEVKQGEVVVGLDTTEQEYRLKEAEADLAEAQQKIIQAKAQKQAAEEEDRYALQKAQADVRLAELDVRRNPLVPAITAKENDLALTNARDHLRQLEQNIANRQATNNAGIAIQEAAAGKSQAQADTARRNIEAMTLRAHRDGYLSVKQNASGAILFFGTTLPVFQTGDAVRPGMDIAEITDLKDWEVRASIGELDRGHLSAGEKVAITIIAVPGRQFHGRVKGLGGTTGPPWDRHFECQISLDDPTRELRPGMNAKIVITTDELHQVLSLPAQALFESDGRTFVYVRSTSGFTPKDVKLIRRSDTRVVIDGVDQGQNVALANPTEQSDNKAQPGGVMQSLKK
jgi:HlyD family secretion protein